MPKLFICTEDDHNDLANVSREMYELSEEPKEISILEGYAHATDIFYTPQKYEIEDLLIDFVNENK
jgi:hypothetical protein